MERTVVNVDATQSNQDWRRTIESEYLTVTGLLVLAGLIAGATWKGRARALRIFGAAWFLILAVFVPYAFRRLDLSATGVGVTLGMYGVGMVVGALAATRIMRRFAFGTVIGLGPVTGFVASAVIALTTIFPTPFLAGRSCFLRGAGPVLWVIRTTTLRQSVTPPRLLGRVSAINILSYGARPVGAGLGALSGGLFGAEACLYLAVAGFAMQMLVILLSQAVSLVRQPEMASD